MPDRQPQCDADTQPTTTSRTTARDPEWRPALRAVLRGLLRTAAALSTVGVTVLYAVHFTLRAHGGGISGDVLQATTLYTALLAVAGIVDLVLASRFREAVVQVAADRIAELADVRADIAGLRADIQDLRQQQPPGVDSRAADEMLGRVEEAMARVVAHAQFVGYAHAVKDLADPTKGVYRLPTRRQPSDTVPTGGRLNER